MAVYMRPDACISFSPAYSLEEESFEKMTWSLCNALMSDSESTSASATEGLER